MRAEATLFAVIIVAACSASTKPAPPVICPDPTPVFDEPVDAKSPCGRACQRLAELGCPESDLSPGGVTCYNVCRRAGPLLDVSCVQAATSRASVAKCGVRCTQ